MKNSKSNNTKQFLALAALSFVFSVSAYAQQGRGLTQTQMQCLDSKLGKPDSGTKPSREKAEAAFKECGVDMANAPGPRGPGQKFDKMTDEQKSCMRNILGEPGQGERPSREKMETALQKCGVEDARSSGGNKARNDQTHVDANGNQ